MSQQSLKLKVIIISFQYILMRTLIKETESLADDVSANLLGKKKQYKVEKTKHKSVIITKQEGGHHKLKSGAAKSYVKSYGELNQTVSFKD